jgi:Protein of unknown function (DUF1571)
MATSHGRFWSLARAGQRRWFWFLLIPSALAGAVAGLSWWLTAPLEDRVTPEAEVAAQVPPVPLPPEEAKRPDVPPEWPEERLEGRPAKQLLLDTMIAVAERLNKVEGYTATFYKQERVKGILGPKQMLAMKVRHRPFAIYFKFLAPKPGKEVVYAEGHHDNKVIAHTGGLAGLLVPRLAVPPDHPLALAETRHAVTEAGLANLTAKLIKFRRMDLDDPEAVTILNRTTGPDGRLWYCSLHLHPHYHPDRPFARVEVLYDPESRFPMQITNYDWPEPGHEGELPLAEQYAYKDLDLDASLTALDFDPANPAYAFHRY